MSTLDSNPTPPDRQSPLELELLGNNPSTPGQNNSISPTKNRLYFIDTIDIIVENELYKVPRIAFEGRAGIPFADAAMIQAEGPNNHIGSPIYLPVSKVDFNSLCHVLYRKIIPGHRSDVTKEEWTSAMKLASMWNMKDIRELAKVKLSELLTDPIELIQAAREAQIASWFRRGCCKLVTQPTTFHPVSLGASISLDTASRLLYIRNKREDALCLKGDAGAIVAVLQTRDTGITARCFNCNILGRFSDNSVAEGQDPWDIPVNSRFELEYPGKAKSSSTKKKKGSQSVPPSQNPASYSSSVDQMIDEEFAEELKSMENAEAAYEL